MTINSLFPIPVGMYKLERKLTKKELDFCKKQKTRPNMGNTNSVNTKVLSSKELTSIKNFIDESLKDYFLKVYEPENNVHLKITQSWLNYTGKGQFHHKHSHPNSFVSGVFYINADKTKDKINFYRYNNDQIQIPAKNWNVWNSTSWWLEAETGGLLLFPSSLQHMVETIDHPEIRISLSFNTFPVGVVGADVDLTQLLVEKIN